MALRGMSAIPSKKKRRTCGHLFFCKTTLVIVQMIFVVNVLRASGNGWSDVTRSRGCQRSRAVMQASESELTPAHSFGAIGSRNGTPALMNDVLAHPCSRPVAVGVFLSKPNQDLEALNLSKNVLSTLPQNFAFLTNLTDLDLSCNHFKDFPTVLCGMTALRQLDVTSNVLTCLPSEVGALTMLNKLHLRHNLLR